MKSDSPSRGRRQARIATVGVAAMMLVVLGAALAGGALAHKRAAATPVAITQAFKYRPGTLHVKAGAKVKFQNESSYTHTATDKGTFDTGHIKPGASKLVKFAKKGTYVFHCEIHPFMTGKVVVE